MPAEELMELQMPHSVMAEQSVLGSMLIDERCVPAVMERLRPDDFYLRQNRALFDVMFTMFNRFETIDPVTVRQKLGGGSEWNTFLLQAMELTPTTAHVREYIRAVREEARLSRLRSLGLELAGAVDKLAQELTALPVRERLQAAAQAVLEAGELDPLGGSTAYDLFIDGSADSEGLSLAFAALCQELNLPCHVAQGTLEGEPHFWTVVQTGEGWRHLDLSVPEAEDSGPFCTDRQFQELGYLWKEGDFPPCTED